MYKIDRVCVYLGGRCNLNCLYCMRELNQGAEWDYEHLSGKMKEYLHSLNSRYIKAVIVNGGEPLLYVDRMREVFEHVPRDVHKKIISNGLLLTQELVDYFNQYEIEFCLSHDGEVTSYTRGVDVLNDAHLLGLIRQIKHLTVSAVCTRLNTNAMQVYEHIYSKLQREFFIMINPMFDNGHNDDLTRGFDYDEYIVSSEQLANSGRVKIPKYYRAGYRVKKQLNCINFTLHGDLINAVTTEYVGDLTEDNQVIEQRMSMINKNCDKKCEIKQECFMRKTVASAHMCELERRMYQYRSKNMKTNSSSFSELNIETVFLMLGNACNFSCRHCIQTPQTDEFATNMSDKCEQYLLFLSGLKPKGQRIRIQFWGGEPLLYFDFIKEFVQKYAETDRFEYSFVTNGSLLTEEIVEFCNTYHICVALSNDGPNTDKIRGVNVLEDEKIRELFMRINCKMINSILTAFSQDIYANWKYFDELCPGVYSNLEFLIHSWKFPQELFEFDLPKLKNTLEQIVAKAKEDTINGMMSRELDFINRHKLKVVEVVKQRANMVELAKLPNCGQMRHTINIDLHGNIYQCHNNNVILGDTDTYYDELWQNYLLSIQPTMEYCKNCQFVAICSSGCPIELLDEQRSLLCEVRKTIISYTIDYILSFNNLDEFIPTKLEEE